MWTVCVYVDDELTELLAEVNGDVYVWYLFVEEGECEWYMYVYVWDPFVEEGDLYMCVYVCYSFVEEGDLYMCVYICYSFVEEGECE